MDLTKYHIAVWKCLSVVALCVSSFYGGRLTKTIDSVPNSKGYENGEVSSRETRQKIAPPLFLSNPQEVNSTSRNLDELWRFKNSLAGKNPNEVLRGLRNMDGGPDEEKCRLLFEAWAADDLISALSAAQADQNRDIQFWATDAVLGVALLDSHEKGLELLLGLPQGSVTLKLAASMFSKWANQDSNSLAKQLININSAVARQSAIFSLSTHYGKSDPESGLRWLDSLSAGSEKDSARNGIVAGWASVDPARAAAFLEREGGPRYDISTYLSVIGEWARTDPSSAVKWAQTIDDKEKRNFLVGNSIISMWSSAHSSEEVLSLAGSLPSGEMRDAALSNLMYNWKTDDFSKLAELYFKDRDSSDRILADSVFASQWVRFDYKGAKEFLESNAIPFTYKSLAQEVKKEEARRIDLLSMGDYIENLGSSDDYTLIPDILTTVINEDPERVSLILKKLESSPRYDHIVNHIASNMGEKSPLDALTWIDANVRSGSQTAAKEPVLDSWLKVDQYSASAYVARMPPSYSKDQAALAVCESVAGADVESALSWALSISDEKTRVRAITTVGKNIDFKSFSNHSEAILNSGISDSELELLQQGLK
jgi:hypothetical protein